MDAVSPARIPPESPCQHSFEDDQGDERAEWRRSMTTRVADWISTFRVASPELLRATSPWCALQCFGQLLYSENIHGFELSHPVEKIDTFWSHSWHGSAWNKVLVLLLFYNGLPALLISSLLAALMFAFSSLGFLPGPEKPLTWGEEGDTFVYSPWGLFCAFPICVGVWLLWRPRSSIFVDRLCIHQSDPEQKALGVLCMGAFLKNSKQMLVLWDATYVERLWCVFELAAFLKCQKDNPAQRLVVRPTCMAQIALTGIVCMAAVNGLSIFVDFGTLGLGPALFWASFLFIFTSGAKVTRGYYFSVDKMKAQLASFQFEKTKCYCCTVNHVEPDGSPLLCDREVIRRCVLEWFGSLEAFEESVRGNVSCALTEALGRFALPLHWIYGVAITTLWTTIGAISAWIFQREYVYALVVLARMLTWWLILGPLAFACISGVGFALRHPCRRQCLDVSKSLLGAAILVVTGGLMFEYQAACFRFAPSLWLACLAFALGPSVLVVAAYTRGKCPGPRKSHA